MIDPFRSRPEIPIEVEALSRLQEVKRWHMVEMSRQQSVMEHSGTVALLAGYVAHGAPGIYFGSSPAVAWYGLVHDIAEAFVGDVPSHTKRRCDGLVGRLEQEFTPPWMSIHSAPVQVIDLIKACDLADAIRFADIFGATRAATNARDSLIQVFHVHIAHCAGYWPAEVSRHVAKVLQDFMTK